MYKLKPLYAAHSVDSTSWAHSSFFQGIPDLFYLKSGVGTVMPLCLIRGSANQGSSRKRLVDIRLKKGLWSTRASRGKSREVEKTFICFIIPKHQSLGFSLQSSDIGLGRTSDEPIAWLCLPEKAETLSDKLEKKSCTGKVPRLSCPFSGERIAT